MEYVEPESFALGGGEGQLLVDRKVATEHMARAVVGFLPCFLLVYFRQPLHLGGATVAAIVLLTAAANQHYNAVGARVRVILT
jgi:hypothetical protein